MFQRVRGFSVRTALIVNSRTRSYSHMCASMQQLVTRYIPVSVTWQRIRNSNIVLSTLLAAHYSDMHSVLSMKARTSGLLLNISSFMQIESPAPSTRMLPSRTVHQQLMSCAHATSRTFRACSSYHNSPMQRLLTPHRCPHCRTTSSSSS